MATSGSRRFLTISAKELKYRTGAALKAVGQHGRVVVTRRGKPVAALINIDELPPPTESEMAELRAEFIRDAERHPLPFSFDEYSAWVRSDRGMPLSIRGRSSSTSAGRKTRGRR